MATPESPTPDPSLKKRFLNWRTLASFAIAAGLIAFTIWQLDIDLAEVWGYLRRANPFLYALGFLAFYTTFPLRAWRWRLLMKNAAVDDSEAPALPGLFDLTEIIFLSWFANCIVPAKLGDLYRGYLLKRTTGASFSRTVGTIFAERVLDMLLLFILMIAASLAVFGPRIPQGQATDFSPTILYAGGVVLVVIAVGVLLALRFFGSSLRRLVPARFRSLYDRFLEGTLLSFRWKNLPLLLGQTAAVWVLESVRFYCVLRAFPEWIDLAIPVVVFIALASSLLTTLPITPAGRGAVELLFAWVVPLFLPTVAETQARAIGFALGILDSTINYWSIVILGLIAFILSKKK
jgi:uncharacterized protein (TIRG00374 family)